VNSDPFQPMSHDPDPVADLSVRYLDHALDEEGTRRLSEAIARDPEACATFDDISRQAFELADAGELDLATAPAQPRRLVRFAPALAAAAVIALVAALLVLREPAPAAGPAPVAELTALECPLSVLLDEDGSLRRRGEAGDTLAVEVGQRLRLPNPTASAELAYADGTRVTLSGAVDARLERSPGGGKQLRLDSGQASADVTPQPSGRPLRILPPTSRLEVLGTSLELSADPEATSVAVTEGRIAVERPSDGARVEVRAGEEVRTLRDGNSPLEVRRTPELKDSWLADFPSMSPGDLQCGKQLRDGTMLAFPRPGTRYTWFTIASRNAWGDGHHSHFQIHEDSVFHIRFKMERPAPFRLMLGTRTTDRERNRGGNAFFEDPAWVEGLEADQWRTISIPINAFDRFEKRNRIRNKRDLVSLAVYYIHLTTMTEDRGLIVDRMWVDRSGS